MNVEYHKWYSPELGQDMELKVYGHTGRPVLVFPAQGGRFYEFEDFGMTEAIRHLADAGRFRFFTVDSVDNQSWANSGIHPADRARRHEDYDRYITHEVAPFIQHYSGEEYPKMIAAGVSMGGYHAANFFFRHPDLFDGVISLSGLLSLRYFIGDYMDELVYFNSPLDYLPDLEDPWYLDQYRQSQIIICCGQGAWEDTMLSDAHAMRQIFETKGIPAWVDLWGYDVNHDWPWWRKQFPYFLEQL
ncbi:MAG: alpha/beta hydrolase-fold protein [Anaerolineae bacterium]